MGVTKKIRLGDLLIQNHIISHDQLLQALTEQKKTGRKLGRTLIDLNFIKETDLLNFLSRQLQIPFIDILRFPRNQEAIQQIPESVARRFRVLVLENTEHDVLVAMSDPTDLMGLDELSRLLKKNIRVAVVRESDLLSVMDQSYRRTSEITHLASKLNVEMSNDIDLKSLLVSEDTADAPVVKLLQSVFEDAFQIKASDIHIEPDDKVLRIRQRVDGMLIEHVLNEINIASALVIRLKLMAGLNISEKRLPMDGRFNIRIKNHSIDVRLSTMPVRHGESIVMRLLDQSQGLLNITSLGIPSLILHNFKRHINSPHGLILVTGPTGSGKTTTLYAALSEANKPETKIITVEDPVEYSLARINQVQVNEKIGLTFANVLRSALRQDPDIILVGEMRDTETAEIAIRASITGHLVFSTLHTNNAVDSTIRLLDMGIKGYILASALRVIIAQRLVRKICEYCIEDYPINNAELDWLESLTQKSYLKAKFKHGVGCQQCNHTGYRGRIGVYELLEMTPESLDALRIEDTQAFAKAAQNTPTFTSYATCAADFAAQGVTSLEEVLRISVEKD